MRIILLVSWISIIEFNFLIVGFISWLLMLFFFFYKRYKYVWALLVFSPFIILPSWSMALGTKHYLKGEAYIQQVGMPSQGFYNLDKTYRLYHKTSGCLVTGTEFLQHVPNNFTVKSLTYLFGYQKDVYIGKYPSYQEAIDKLNEDGVNLNSKTINDHMVFLLENEKHHLKIASRRRGNDEIKVTKFGDECLIIFLSGDSPHLPIYLYDLKNKKIFAIYQQI